LFLASSLTHKGLVRANNEDAFVSMPELGLFAVADGLGGHAAGEIASALATETLESRIAPPLESEDVDVETLKGALVEAVKDANRRIIEKAEQDAKLRGMGTTLTALVLLPKKDIYAIAHVGDSRLYLLRSSKLAQLTLDHTYVQDLVDKDLLTPEEARSHPYRHALTRALGIGSDVEVELASGELKAGDMFLLCTDGLTNEVPDPQIAEIMNVHRAEPELCVQKLVAQALSNGGRDNVTVIAVTFGSAQDG